VGVSDGRQAIFELAQRADLNKGFLSHQLMGGLTTVVFLREMLFQQQLQQ